jgi:hypothetical protein
MNLKRKIDQRQPANLDILTIIEEAVMKYPDLRFGQILAMFDIIQYKTVNKIGALGAHVIEPVDPFYEESVDMLTRVKNKIQNLDKNQNNHE